MEIGFSKQPVEKIKHLHKWNRNAYELEGSALQMHQLTYKSSGIPIKILMAMMKWKYEIDLCIHMKNYRLKNWHEHFEAEDSLLMIYAMRHFKPTVIKTVLHLIQGKHLDRWIHT